MVEDVISRLIVKALKEEELLRIGNRSYLNAFRYPESRFDAKDLMPNGGNLKVLDSLQSLKDPRMLFTDKYIIPPDQLVFSLAGKCYRKSWLGEIAGGVTNAAAVINDALGALTPGRTWKEKVVVKGNYENLDYITIPPFTVFEVLGNLKAKNALNRHFINCANASNVEILGGVFDGNGPNQTANMNTIYFYNVVDSLIRGVTVWTGRRVTTDGEGIELESCQRVTVTECLGLGLVAGYDPIKLTGNSFYCVIANNIIDQTKDGSYSSRAIQVVTGSYNLVIGNVVYGNGNNPAYKFHSANRNVIADNIAYDCTEGVALIANASENLVIGNLLYASNFSTMANAGLDIRATDTDNAYRNMFIGNTVILRGIANHQGIYLGKNARYTIVKDNRIIGTTATGEIGINIASGASDTYLEGNDLTDPNLETKVSDAGTNTVIGGIIHNVTIMSTATAATWTDMPAALTEFLGVTRHRVSYDLRRALQVRLMVNVATAGAADAKLRAQYSKDGGATWSYLDGATGPEVAIGTTGLKVSSWAYLPTGAMAEVLLRVVGLDGDGVADPAFNNLILQFRG
jgi:parallel beta-helix repeat protein